MFKPKNLIIKEKLSNITINYISFKLFPTKCLFSYKIDIDKSLFDVYPFNLIKDFSEPILTKN